MKAGQGQTLTDVAVLHSGTAEAVWDMAVRNGLSLTDSVSGGELELPVATDPDTAAELQGSGANPATDGDPQALRRRPIGRATIGKDRIW